MEIAVVSDNTLKVRSKNSSFLVNPTKLSDSDAILLTNKANDYGIYDGKLVIDGPGEYEVAGVSIKGEKGSAGTSYDLLEENQKLLVIDAEDVGKSKGGDDYIATLVVGANPVGQAELEKITSGVVIVLGAGLEASNDGIKKIDKINLKKIDEYKGFIVHLTKN